MEGQISNALSGSAQRPTDLGSILLKIDKVLEAIAIGLLVMMIFIVFIQVVTRKLFSYVIPWSEEATLLCLTWFSFMGIAIGFREKLHLAMDVIEGLLSKTTVKVLDYFISIVCFLFGVYLIYYGTQFCILMSESTLPCTHLPNSVQYLVVPITGVMTCVYTFLQLCGKDLRRFHKVEEEIKRDDA